MYRELFYVGEIPSAEVYHAVDTPGVGAEVKRIVDDRGEIGFDADYVLTYQSLMTTDAVTVAYDS